MKSNVEWIHWGRRDPLYAVAVWEGRERDGPRPWTDEEFYELGRSDWEDFRARWQRYGLAPESCVEVGCGAGRLTKHLAAAFARVVAVDVSADMIEYARTHAGAPNVRFEVTDGDTLPLGDGSVTAAFSTHVFQHFDSMADGARVLREILRVLAPSGTAMVHLPVHRRPPGRAGLPTRAAARIEKLREDAAAWRARRRIRRGGDSALMRYLSYDLDWLERTLPELGFADTELVSFPVRANGAWHTFALGRKPAA